SANASTADSSNTGRFRRRVVRDVALVGMSRREATSCLVRRLSGLFRMKRSRIGNRDHMRHFLLAVLLTGCLHTSTSEPAKITAEDAWETHALPILRGAGCIDCHGGSDAIGFLAGSTPEEIRATLLGFSPVEVDLNTPEDSGLVTKGIHAGNALTADQTSALL